MAQELRFTTRGLELTAQVTSSGKFTCTLPNGKVLTANTYDKLKDMAGKEAIEQSRAVRIMKFDSAPRWDEKQLEEVLVVAVRGDKLISMDAFSNRNTLSVGYRESLMPMLTPEQQQKLTFLAAEKIRIEKELEEMIYELQLRASTVIKAVLGEDVPGVVPMTPEEVTAWQKAEKDRIHRKQLAQNADEADDDDDDSEALAAEAAQADDAEAAQAEAEAAAAAMEAEYDAENPSRE